MSRSAFQHAYKKHFGRRITTDPERPAIGKCIYVISVVLPHLATDRLNLAERITISFQMVSHDHDPVTALAAGTNLLVAESAAAATAAAKAIGAVISGESTKRAIVSRSATATASSSRNTAVGRGSIVNRVGIIGIAAAATTGIIDFLSCNGAAYAVAADSGHASCLPANPFVLRTHTASS